MSTPRLSTLPILAQGVMFDMPNDEGSDARCMKMPERFSLNQSKMMFRLSNRPISTPMSSLRLSSHVALGLP